MYVSGLAAGHVWQARRPKTAPTRAQKLRVWGDHRWGHRWGGWVAGWGGAAWMENRAALWKEGGQEGAPQRNWVDETGSDGSQKTCKYGVVGAGAENSGWAVNESWAAGGPSEADDNEMTRGGGLFESTGRGSGSKTAACCGFVWRSKGGAPAPGQESRIRYSIDRWDAMRCNAMRGAAVGSDGRISTVERGRVQTRESI